MRRIAGTLAVLALLGGTAACGGDDKGPALSAEEFVKQANAACVAGDEELEKAGEDLVKSGQPKTQEIADFFLDKAVPIARRKLDQIEDLNPPADKRAAVKDMLAAGREAIDEVAEGLGDDPEAYLNEKGPDPFDDFDEMAREMGLDRCASQAEPLPGEGDPTTTTTTTPAAPAPPDTTPTTAAQ
ncbi:MAG: hypothetical protein ACRD0O_13770 [Acidimicrobiia bacterium]